VVKLIRRLEEGRGRGEGEEGKRREEGVKENWVGKG